MKKSLLIGMRGLMALMAVAPLVAGCGEKTVAPGKNDTPEIKAQRGQKSGDEFRRLPGKKDVERREHIAPGARFYRA